MITKRIDARFDGASIYSLVWTYEGIAWYALPASAPIPGAPLPDLGGDSLTGAAVAIRPGGTLMISPSYYNVYTAPVGPDFTIQYRLSLNTIWGDAVNELDETNNVRSTWTRLIVSPVAPY